MDPAPQPAKAGHRSLLRFVVAGLMFLLIASLVCFLLEGPRDKQIVWLSPARFAQASRPGLFTRLRQNVTSLPVISKLLRRYRRIPPNITLACSVMALSPAAIESAGLGKPATIQPNGTRAWILPQSEWTSLMQRMRTNSGARVFAQSTILTSAGLQAGTRMLYTKSLSPHDPDASDKASIVTDIVPRTGAGSLNMLLRLQSVELGGLNGPGPPILLTNLAVACMTILPSGSGLALDCGSLTSSYGTNCWFFLSAAILKPAPPPAPVPMAGTPGVPPASR